MKTLILGFLALTGLSACAAPPVDVAGDVPSGGEYGRAVMTGYVRLAAWEREQYDWPDAALFAAKAARAAAGEMPLAEDPGRWRLDARNRHKATLLRDRLLRYAAAGAARRWPGAAARTQIFYDCWLEQREEGWQQPHIEACRKGMDAGLTDLAATMPWAAGAPGALQIHFATGRFALTAADKARLADFTDRALARGVRRFLVQGHADRQGGRAYNRLLSERRAATVAAWMRRHVRDEQTVILTAALGEMLPLVPTADGKAQADNRRVSVFTCSGRCPGEPPQEVLPLAVPAVDRRPPILAAEERGR